MDLFTRVGAAVLFIVGGSLHLFAIDDGRLSAITGAFDGIGMPEITAHTETEPDITSTDQTASDMAFDAFDTISDAMVEPEADAADGTADVWGDLSEREDPFAKSSVFPRTPLLRLNTRHHTHKIKRIDLDDAGQYLVTSSYDKTARVWKMPSRAGETPELLRVLRPPIGPGHLGRIFGVAMSPDGTKVAVAGWTHWVAGISEEDEFLYVFDRETGRMVHRFAGLDDIVHDLAFSPDGRFLAAGLSRNGIRVFDMTSDEAGRDKVAKDKTYGGQVYGLSFSPDGRLATASYDGLVRLYGADLTVSSLTPTHTTYTPHGEQPHDLAFSPDGTKLAVGYFDQPEVSLLSADDLTELDTPNTDGIALGDLLTVRWSKDGTYLYAGGRWRNEDGQHLIRRWTQDGQGPYEDLVAGAHTVLDLHEWGQGGLVFAAADPTVAAFDGLGNRAMPPLPLAASWLAAPDTTLDVSHDGAEMTLTYGQGPDRLSLGFNVHRRRLDLDMGDDDYAADEDDIVGTVSLTDNASTDDLTALDNDIEVTGWQNGPTPRINGEPIYLPNGEWSRAMALAPDGGHVLLGTEKNLRYYNAAAKQLWQVKAPGAALHVAVTRDGKKAVAAYHDGTIRWHRLSDGRELFALYVDNDLRRWVFWTPDGLYDASTGGDDLIGWHINQGDAQEALFYGASRFKALFHKPDRVAAALDSLAASPAPSRDAILANLPPVGRIQQVGQGEAGAPVVFYTVTAPSRDPIELVRVTVDGRTQELTAADLTVTEDGALEIPLACEQGDVEVSLAAKTAVSGYGEADTAALGTLCNFDS